MSHVPEAAKRKYTPPAASALVTRWLFNRWVLVTIAFLVIAAGLALNWDWLVTAGLAPILIALLPCAAMCALGLCMMGRKSGSTSCSESPAAPTKESNRRA